MKPTIIIILVLGFLTKTSIAQEVSRDFDIDKRYLNLPVQISQDRQPMTFEVDGKEERNFVIRLSDGEPDYWVFADMTHLMDKTVTVKYPEEVKGFDKIYQADSFAGEDSVYQEVNRPQLHFSSRRGWNNDPNGLVHYEGEYHLYYQHNPYEANWQNMHWGHAVSTDLIHWQELSTALYPDDLGTMFSGSAAVDWNNDSGFQTGDDPPIIAAYTANKNLADGDVIQTQNIAYSNDRGRTFTKYNGNPVIDSKETWGSIHTRDPKIFWHGLTQKWVMVLFEKDGHSFYSSSDLKEWNYLSHLVGFWECPELFELPVDGNKYNTKWIVYGASGTYMIGDFDGHEFKVESGKHQFVSGAHYAAQTYNDIPDEDGRRIQIGWGQITHQGMPFKSMMLFPTTLTLRSTRNGIRLFSEPIEEIGRLHKKSYRWDNLTSREANEHLKSVNGDLFHIRIKVEIVEGTGFQFRYNGSRVAAYTMNHNLLNGRFYEGDDPESNAIELEILIDRTSLEVFADRGRFTIVEILPAAQNDRGLEFFAGDEVKIHYLEVHEMTSIWEMDVQGPEEGR